MPAMHARAPHATDISSQIAAPDLAPWLNKVMTRETKENTRQSICSAACNLTIYLYIEYYFSSIEYFADFYKYKILYQ
jgi:hypothetical protein